MFFCLTVVDRSPQANTLDFLSISNIDVGIRLTGDVNGNLISQCNMIAIGQYGYHFTYRATENMVVGGFVGGHGGEATHAMFSLLP